MATEMNLSMLQKEEREQLLALPIYISVLIASADGTIDQYEIKKAADFSSWINSRQGAELGGFFQEASKDFEDKLKVVVASLPMKADKSVEFLFAQIREVNNVLKKIDRQCALALHESLKEFARYIAGASGGIFGIGSIGHEELQLIDLKMIEVPG